MAFPFEGSSLLDRGPAAAGFQSRFRAYRGLPAINLVGAGPFLIAFNAEVYDTLGEYDVATFRFVPTVAGYYLINTQLDFTVVAGGAYGYVRIEVNGGGAYASNLVPRPAGQDVYLQATCILNLAAGDIVEVYAGFPAGSTMTLNAGTPQFTWNCFEGHRLS